VSRAFVYFYDEDGDERDDLAAHAQALLSLSGEHKTPGLGIGRECHGFVNLVTVRDAAAHLMPVEVHPSQARPLRLKVWAPDAAPRWLWLVHPSTPRSEVDRLRELMWPTP
jgi:hypothetical protein